MDNAITVALAALYTFLVDSLPADLAVNIDGYSVLISGDDKGRVRAAKKLAARFHKLSTGTKLRHATHNGAKTWRKGSLGEFTCGVEWAPTEDIKCDRCGGAGKIQAFHYHANGTCFECSGTGIDDMKIGGMV